MRYYIGMDVSLKSMHTGVLDDDRSIVWRGVSDTHPELIADKLKRWHGCIELLDLETGSLTPWLYHSLKRLGLPVVYGCEAGVSCGERAGGKERPGRCAGFGGDACNQLVFFGF
jgi:hypothetical protein